MRILVTIERLTPTGGREISTLQLTRALSKKGHEIDLYYGIGGELEAEYGAFCRSITRAHLRIRRPGLAGNMLRGAPALLSAARRHPDVVYVQSFGDIPFGSVVSRLSRVPLVCHLRGFSPYRKTALLARQVSRFIAVSRDTRERWTDAGIDPGCIDVVHNGIELDEYPFGDEADRHSARKRLGIPFQAFLVLYYGRLDKEKGVEVLLEAWQRLGIAPEEGRLLIMGDAVIDPEPEARRRHLQELAPPGCEWLPSRRDTIRPLHAADVVVVPSFDEGFGRAIIESMATGRPVLGSRVGGIPEALTPPFDRYLFEPGNAGQLCQALESLKGWRQTDPGLGERCRKYVVERFTIEQTAGGVEKVLISTVDGPTTAESPVLSHS